MQVYVLIGVALIFDFMNGFHDAANSIATIVSTGVLKPKQAVLWAAFFNFIAFLVFGLQVAFTIGKGIVDPTVVTNSVIMAALSGAIIWDLVTWYFGLPSSSMHALVGALGGAVLVKAGFGALQLSGFIKIVLSIFLSPILGAIISFVLLKSERLFFKNVSKSKKDKMSRKLQLVSAAMYSLSHGGNDAQKTLGIIAILLLNSGLISGPFHVPFWVVISCHASMALGTYFGGWRIVKTMGEKLVKLIPETGCCAETSGAITIFIATRLGIPVSTTHTIAGSIVGVGLGDSIKKVNWSVIKQIVVAWFVTLPACALTGAILWYVIHKLFDSGP